MALKLNKANAMLSKLRYGLGTKTLRPVYYAVFESMLHLFRYKTLIFKRFHLLQKKSLRIMFFQNRNFQTGPLLQTSKILKTFNKAAFKNCIFIRKSLKGLLRSIFNNWFKFSFEPHSHDTRWSNLSYLKITSYHTKTYDRYQCFWIQYMFGTTYKVSIKMLYFSNWEQINWKRH